MKNSIKKFDVRKFRIAAIKMIITACTIAMACSTAMMMAYAEGNAGNAGNSENGTPDNINTGTMDTLISIIFWAVRILIIIVGAVPGIIKINQGNADENPKERNAGISSVVVAGVCFAARIYILLFVLFFIL